MVTTVVGLGQQGATLAQELVGMFAEEAETCEKASMKPALSPRSSNPSASPKFW